MNRPLFSILHTSARPEKWRAVYDDWISKAAHPEQVEYVLCVDERWGFKKPFTTDPLSVKVLDWAEQFGRAALNRLCWNQGRKCYVDGVNTAAKASTGQILIVNADDLFPCEKWDEELRRLLFAREETVETPFVIEVSTGTPEEHDRGILVMPILSRARYEAQGSVVFYPAYESMFPDNDIWEWAYQDDVIIDARHLKFEHRHPLFDSTRKWDAVYEHQNRKEAHEAGQTILNWRRLVRFGNAIKEAEAIEGWMSTSELECISLFASQVESVIEIGSWKGRSTYALCKGTTGKVTAVDHFHGSRDEPLHVEPLKLCGGSTFAEFQYNMRRCSNLSVVMKDSLEAAKEVPDADMVFFDGDHSYEHMVPELKVWVRKARKLICGHDLGYQGVERAVKDVLGEVEHGPDSIWFKRLSSKRSIALCLSGDDFKGPWVDGILNLWAHLIDLDFTVWKARGYTSNVYVTREEIRKAVLTFVPKPDLLLWLDDDNIVTPDQFDRLLGDLDSRPDVDGVTAWCWVHSEDKQWFRPSCGLWAPDHIHWQPFDSTLANENRLRDVEVGGFPCFLMRLSGLEKAGETPFLPVLDSRLPHGICGEDIAFFLAAEKGGAKFLVDPQVRVAHLKYVTVEPVLPEEGTPADVKVACMMRVKDEARWIKRVIGSVKDLCGENIYVMDDGSTDDTAALALSAGAKVFPSPFVGLPLDEVRDKNWLLAFVRAECNPDWILAVDGDEELEQGGCDKILAVLRTNPYVDCFGLRILFLWDSVDQIRVDRRFSTTARQSLFRALPGYDFRSYYEGTPGGVTHSGLHCSNAPFQMRTAPLNVFLLHYGYLFRQDRIRKYRWYISIDPHNECEDHYRHSVQGDIPEVPADAILKWAGPLELRKLPARLVPRFEVLPGPLDGSDDGHRRRSSETAMLAGNDGNGDGRSVNAGTGDGGPSSGLPVGPDEKLMEFVEVP